MVEPPREVVPSLPVPAEGHSWTGPEGGGRACLFRSLARVLTLQEETERAAAEVVRGPGGDVDDLMAAVRKATEAFHTLMQVRHHILTVYERMQKTRLEG